MEGEAVAAAGGEGGDWRTYLQRDSRQKIVNKIMETLKRHLPFSGQEGLLELKKIAVRFEEKIYTAATSQSDYLRKISLKMLTMEAKSQNPLPNSLQSNGASSKNPQDNPAASQSMQSQMQNQVQQPSIPICNQSQVRQQLLSLNIQTNISSTGLPNSTGLTSAFPPVGQMSEVIMPNVPGTNPSMHNMYNVNPNAVGNSLGLDVPSNIFSNSQRQIQVRQQQVVNQEQQQLSQNSQYLYNQQLQQHLMKQNLQSIMQSQMQQQQQQQQQQNLLQQNQLQSSPQAVMQPSLRQSSASSTLQNQQPSLRESTQSMLQQQSQSVLRQQQQQPQQPFVMHQPQTSMPQHSMLPTQQQLQQLSEQQSNTANMQQNQLIGQPNRALKAQQQHQQGQKMVTQQNNISNMQPQQTISQQNNLANMHQQQSTGQQNSIPTVHQHQLGPQSNLSGFQQPQMGEIQHGNSSLQTNKPPVYMIQQSKVSAQHQMQHSMASMLPNQAQQLQPWPMQHQLMLQIQSQQGQLQQPLGLPQKGTTLPDMEQRVQTSSPMLQQQTTIDQHKQLLQSVRGVPEVPPISLDSSSQTSNVSGGDWQEEIYQKIKSLNEMYFPELNEMYQRVAAKLLQHDAHPQQLQNEQLEKLRFFKVMLERLIMFLQTEKQDIQPSHKEKIAAVHRQIVNILSSNRPQKNVSLLQQGLLAQPHTHAMQQPQQQQPQISQMRTNDGQMNSQMQPMNVQGSVVTTQQNTLNSLQHNSFSSVSSLDSSSETSNINSGDWQEEIYQKIKSLNEMYFPELNEMYQRMALKLQQQYAHPQQLKNERLEKLKFFKIMLERLTMFLQTKKQDIQPSHEEMIAAVHKVIVNVLSSNGPRKNVALLQQGLLAQAHTRAMQQPQQRQPQVSQMHVNDGQMNSQMQPMNVQGSVVTTQQNTLNSLQHNSLSSVSSVQNSR